MREWVCVAGDVECGGLPPFLKAKLASPPCRKFELYRQIPGFREASLALGERQQAAALHVTRVSQFWSGASPRPTGDGMAWGGLTYFRAFSPIANRCLAPRTKSVPAETAGVAITISPTLFCATNSNRGPVLMVNASPS